MLTQVVVRRCEGQDGERTVDVDLPEGDLDVSNGSDHI